MGRGSQRVETLVEYVRRLSEQGIIPLFANKGDGIIDEERRVYTMGDLLEHCYTHSFTYWRARYASSITFDDLYGGPIIEGRLEVLYMSGGRCTVQVSVEARRQRESETYLFKGQRAGPNKWYVTASSFTLD